MNSIELNNTKNGEKYAVNLRDFFEPIVELFFVKFSNNQVDFSV